MQLIELDKLIDTIGTEGESFDTFLFLNLEDPLSFVIDPEQLHKIVESSYCQ